jgi:hypothetical protein
MEYAVCVFLSARMAGDRREIWQLEIYQSQSKKHAAEREPSSSPQCREGLDIWPYCG